jgi:hypothetical protein
MSETNDGGQAFPIPAGDYTGSKHGNRAYAGMTLRDYFAAKALQGLLSAGMYDTKGSACCAGEAFALADAMLKARGD